MEIGSAGNGLLTAGVVNIASGRLVRLPGTTLSGGASSALVVAAA